MVDPVFERSVIIVHLQEVFKAKILRYVETGVARINNRTTVVEIIKLINLFCNRFLVEHYDILGSEFRIVFVRFFILVVNHDKDWTGVSILAQRIVCHDLFRASVRQDENAKVGIIVFHVHLCKAWRFPRCI